MIFGMCMPIVFFFYYNFTDSPDILDKLCANYLCNMQCLEQYFQSNVDVVSYESGPVVYTGNAMRCIVLKYA